jgi:hypothetical protein
LKFGALKSTKVALWFARLANCCNELVVVMRPRVEGLGSDESLRSATSSALRDLLSLDHSKIDSLIPASHSTAHRYIVD